ncbi:VOC family protein [Aeromicrobium alkaliterrae]|uniref:VOC family protein n=1 Tax=Aeromicrobium alkaliterrae TaxID=302168 RepID=A0ABN2KBN8_9ACTN
MTTTAFYPVLMSADVGAAADFYREALGFTTTYDSDWYVSLRLGAFELGLVAHDHPTVPEGYRALPQGVIVNLEVGDVDAVHARLVELGIDPILPLRDEDFGQRHVIVAAPDGVLLDVITPTEPTSEFAPAYA